MIAKGRKAITPFLAPPAREESGAILEDDVNFHRKCGNVTPVTFVASYPEGS